ncbi:MAG TPA: hypothetical protein VI795_00545 [Patescibacteria group bacterium]|nr:hypothetical protein [Patescibacteria group bacterium]
MKKIIMRNIIWTINTLLLIVVVFLGIEQGGIGAQVRKIDENLENQDDVKREISEKIYENQELGNNQKIQELGFVKPENILYFDTEEAVAKLPVQ